MSPPRAKWGGGTLVVPAPLEVDEQMRRVPRGKVVTMNDIRAALAQRPQGARRSRRWSNGRAIPTGSCAWG